MNKIWILAFLTLGANASLFAQSSGQGHVFVGVEGPGRAEVDSSFSVGGGYEGFVYRGLAVGADIGYVAPRGDFTEYGFGLLSAGPSYHFTNRLRTNKFVPFVTGGYGLAFRGETLNTGFYGVGATYWFTDRLGARAEFRDYRTQYGQLMSTFRFSLSFR